MRYTLSFLAFIITATAAAQVRFASNSLEKMFEKLPPVCKSQLIEKQECIYSINGTEYNMACEIFDEQIIKLGLRIFEDSTINNYNSSVCSFIEGELLKFILDDGKAREARRNEDQVYLFYSNLLQENGILKNPDYIKRVTSDINGVAINMKNLKYQVLITNTFGERLMMEFPAINTLITGMDKKELEENLFKNLIVEKNSLLNHSNNHPAGNLQKEGELLVTQGNYFLIDDFSSKLFFIKIKDSLKLVFDPKYARESFSNLFLTGGSNSHSVVIDLKLKGYGNEDKSLTMPLNKFLSIFDNQYELYFGIEDSSANSLRGSFIIFNPALNYIHLCDIKTESGTLFANHPSITVAMYPFIPTHNIKNLFGKEAGNKTQLLKNIMEDEYEK
ncbi:MAG: hypothetical protein RBS07_10970 [Lentimicrobium sp.]|jgi:hypothetical protein|nr:hypothetical protein [Lentimicrobium sp.]